jgi:hypothetical protein
VEVEEAARRWASVWAAGWREHDVDAIVALYAQGARHRSAVDREPHFGPEGVRAYCEWAFSDESQAHTWFPEPVTWDDRAAGWWWAISTNTNGDAVTLAGVSRIVFDRAGLVVDQHDVWTQFDGAHRPFEGWGP